MARLIQTPAPGSHILLYTGDTFDFILESDSPVKGKAYLRTNIGNAHLRRAEIISSVENRTAQAAQDWHNIQMNRIDEFTFKVSLSLVQEGHFEAKCCIFPDENTEPIWGEGDNVHINIEPASYCCSNSIYCAFPRQFGVNKNKPASTLPGGISKDEIDLLDKNKYAVIPPSGTFRDLMKELDHIFDRLNCRILHLLPINPTPTVYGRMGRYGSPYAALDFTSVDPALAEFDRKSTPLDQFLELVDAVHRKNGRLIIDIAINHTGWAARIHEEHADWLVRENDGSIHSPGAWGVVWGDLTELNHNRLDLWKYLADVFIVWCARGVDGFRCDAGYMIPVPAWEYIIARVRSEYPETIFLLEGLGGDPAVTTRLLDVANMNWAYSELFQNYSRQQIEGYLNYAWKQSRGDGLMVHYAETHDNNRMAAISKKYAKMRTALSALTSANGAFGFANGVEWYAEEKIDVHESSALNWLAPVNQVEHIARLNSILASNPAFHNGSTMSVVDSGSPFAVVISRSDVNSAKNVLVAVNLECDRSTEISWSAASAMFDTEFAYDLISGKKVQIRKLPGSKRGTVLSGGQAMCLSPDESDVEKILEIESRKTFLPEKLEMQEALTMALRILAVKKQSHVVSEETPEHLAAKLLESPEGLFAELYGDGLEKPFTRWEWPADNRREVMLPPNHFMLVTAPYRFRATLEGSGRKVSYQVNSLRDSHGRFFAVIPPSEVPETHTRVRLRMSVFGENRLERSEAVVLLLAHECYQARIKLKAAELYASKHTFLQANGRGAILRPCVEPNAIRSRYDAVLLGNLSPEFPENRHIMLRRFRMWAIYQARTQEFGTDCLKDFYISADGGGVWKYKLPIGNGLFIDATVKLEIIPGANAVMFTLRREIQRHKTCRLCNDLPVKMIIRPDIEDRSFHYETKASMGPEKTWPGMVRGEEKGFEFTPASDRILRLHSSKGCFRNAPEWIYMINQENESARGLEPNTDVFSPGYFEMPLSGDETVYLCGQMVTDRSVKKIIPAKLQEKPFEEADPSIEKVMISALRQFVVARGKLKTVIAGYPWFLDWGRDTLIAARGLIAAPEFRKDVKDILLQFASFAENGTIPNMICGGDACNRDTSDAQLWLFTACSDLCKAEGNFDFLQTEVRKGEKLISVLESLADGLMKDTPNGIHFDVDTGLIYSPAHFTWMDTNYPAGTPRKGYPVEIQALWFAALKFLSSVSESDSGSQKWDDLAQKVQRSIMKYFVIPDKHWLSDCLHCETPDTKASAATPDDHLRSNQLLAVTLGAVTDKKVVEAVVRSSASLLIPGAIRSLADRKVSFKLPVRNSAGNVLNNPEYPYWGRYEGDEDTRRKPAYHNGTAWTWPFPSYCEAYMIAYGESGRETAQAVLSSSVNILNDGCVGQIPEVLDGDFPHTQRGCDAQAWGVSELYRVWKLLHPNGVVPPSAD